MNKNSCVCVFVKNVDTYFNFYIGTILIDNIPVWYWMEIIYLDYTVLLSQCWVFSVNTRNNVHIVREKQVHNRERENVVALCYNHGPIKK